VPKADRERDAYGIKVPTMAKLYVKVLGIDGRSAEAKQLTATNYDDYSTVVYDIMVKRAVKECSLSVWDVNQHLDAMAQGHQNNSRKRECGIFP
jgi:DNA ligase 4